MSGSSPNGGSPTGRYRPIPFVATNRFVGISTEFAGISERYYAEKRKAIQRAAEAEAARTAAFYPNASPTRTPTIGTSPTRQPVNSTQTPPRLHIMTTTGEDGLEVGLGEMSQPHASHTLPQLSPTSSLLDMEEVREHEYACESPTTAQVSADMVEKMNLWPKPHVAIHKTIATSPAAAANAAAIFQSPSPTRPNHHLHDANVSALSPSPSSSPAFNFTITLPPSSPALKKSSSSHQRPDLSREGSLDRELASHGPYSHRSLQRHQHNLSQSSLNSRPESSVCSSTTPSERSSPLRPGATSTSISNFGSQTHLNRRWMNEDSSLAPSLAPSGRNSAIGMTGSRSARNSGGLAATIGNGVLKVSGNQVTFAPGVAAISNTLSISEDLIENPSSSSAPPTTSELSSSVENDADPEMMLDSTHQKSASNMVVEEMNHHLDVDMLPGRDRRSSSSASAAVNQLISPGSVGSVSSQGSQVSIHSLNTLNASLEREHLTTQPIPLSSHPHASSSVFSPGSTTSSHDSCFMSTPCGPSSLSHNSDSAGGGPPRRNPRPKRRRQDDDTSVTDEEECVKTQSKLTRESSASSSNGRATALKQAPTTTTTNAVVAQQPSRTTSSTTSSNSFTDSNVTLTRPGALTRSTSAPTVTCDSSSSFASSSASSSRVVVAPPPPQVYYSPRPLTQQTPRRKALVSTLACCLRQLYSNPNDTLPEDPRCLTRFHTERLPPVNIGDYLERIAFYSECSEEALICALIHISRVSHLYSYQQAHGITPEAVINTEAGSRHVIPFHLNALSIHRLLLTAILITVKFFDDAYYNNAFYAKIGGVTVRELNILEIDLLELIQFNMDIGPKVYIEFYEQLKQPHLHRQCHCGFKYLPDLDVEAIFNPPQI